MKGWELRAPGMDNLVLVDRPQPVPGPRQVAVRIRAAALNSRDLQVVHGIYDPAQHYPVVPVSDGAGEVVAVGPEVKRLKVGDRVTGALAQRWVSGRRTWDRWASTLGGNMDGMLQEVALLDEDGAVTVPDRIDFVAAAAAGVAGSTAWQALVEQGGVKAGQTVLALGTGGVSLFALQFAVLSGARVIVTSSSDEKIERARALGAWAGVNYRTHPEWNQEVLALTGGVGADHVIENVGDLRRSVNSLAVGGLISGIGYLSQLDFSGAGGPATYQVEIISVLMKNARLQGITVAPRESYDSMFNAMAAHGLKPVIDQVVPFADAKAAFERLRSGRAFGKICITL